MRIPFAIAAAATAVAAVLATASADTRDDRTLKAPPKTMGDKGKLPATDSMSGHVPTMTGPRTAATPGNEHSGPTGPKGPPKRMGDEGKLPATDNMSGHVPPMTPSK